MPPDAGVHPPELSDALRQAQARLLQLRAERGIVGAAAAASRPPAAAPGDSPSPGDSVSPNWPLLNAQKELQRRRAVVSDQDSVVSGQWPVVGGRQPAVVSPGPPPATRPLPPATVVVHPTILLAMLRQRREAAGRVWLLLRAGDGDGRGWVAVDDARRQLTEAGSPRRACGWKRLRQLLREGEGLFWRRDAQDRLWLFGAHRTAAALDCYQLQGWPIELPIETLLGGIQKVRAAFYAAFHGGRDARPISRRTLRDLSGVPARTQLEYDRVARVARTRNFAIGERYTAENAQERAWRHGRAAFHFVDAKGRQGRAGREYVAWHLPNSYQTAYQRRSRGSRKRLNRKLADLVNNGIPGNDERGIERLFFPTGAPAVRQYNRDPRRDAYWRQETPTRARGVLWRVIAGLGV